MVSADDGSWKSQTTVTIYILDENDVTPQFTEESYEFDVNIPKNVSNQFNITVGSVTALDQDKSLNGVINYKLKNKSKYFSIDSRTGQIAIKQLPKLFSTSDTFYLNQYYLTVIASDKGFLPRFSEVKVIIRFHVSDEGVDSSGHFNLVVINIPVNLENQTLLYNSNSMILLVDHEIGIVKTHYNQLLFCGQSLVQKDETYIFIVDNSFSKVVFNLTIIDTNQNAPIFSNVPNLTTISEIVTGFTQIDQFNAVDHDSSLYNNIVTYSYNISKIHCHPNARNYLTLHFKEKYPNIFKMNLSTTEIISNIAEISYILNPFILNQADGKLFIKNSLDYELIVRYDLSIIAQDNAWYPLQTSIDISIVVDDVDDYIDYSKFHIEFFLYRFLINFL